MKRDRRNRGETVTDSGETRRNEFLEFIVEFSIYMSQAGGDSSRLRSSANLWETLWKLIIARRVAVESVRDKENER